MAEVGSIAAGRSGAALRLLGDRTLARLAARGDARAFAAIYERHHQELYRYCRSLTGDPEDASDALQSTMVAVLRALPGETRQIRLRPWLFRIAHNESISLIRRRRVVDELCDSTALLAPGPHSEASVRERLGRLFVDLRDLPERQRGALLMRELSGLSYDEIGAALGGSPAAARQAVHEARTALSELADGRDMGCAAARKRLSASDARLLRGRKLRAHLKSCHGCTDYSEQVVERRAALRTLVPPLPAATGATILAGVLGIGGGGVGGGGVVSLAGGAASQLAGVSAALKGAAAVSLAVAAGVGTVEVAVHHSPPGTGASRHAAAGSSPAAATRRANPAAEVHRLARRRAASFVPARRIDAAPVRPRPPSPPPAPSEGLPSAGGGDGEAPSAPERAAAPPPPVSAPEPGTAIVPVAQPPSPPAPPRWPRDHPEDPADGQQALTFREQVRMNAMVLAREMVSRFLPQTLR